MSLYQCDLNLPYPEIKVTAKNLCYANLLLNDYAGMFSELSAVTSYFYQHLVLNCEYVELSNALECISISEMKHLGILGELICLLGGNPQLRTVNKYGNFYWSSSVVKNIQNPKKILELNIASEKKAIETYTIRIKQINDEYIKKILKRIILDEENHKAIFEKYLNEF